jgi:hypothetical protein
MVHALYNDTCGRGHFNLKDYLTRHGQLPEVIFGIIIASPAGVIVKHWIHSCFQQQLAAWLRSQRVNVAPWYSAPSTTT